MCRRFNSCQHHDARQVAGVFRDIIAIIGRFGHYFAWFNISESSQSVTVLRRSRAVFLGPGAVPGSATPAVFLDRREESAPTCSPHRRAGRKPHSHLHTRDGRKPPSWGPFTSFFTPPTARPLTLVQESPFCCTKYVFEGPVSTPGGYFATVSLLEHQPTSGFPPVRQNKA